MDLPQLIGQSPSIAELRARITRLLVTAARGTRPPAVLIQGETGTGKGLVASLLHRMSSRARAAFVDVNCAAIPESLLESELFGYERGAFTDARRSKPGLFQEAHGGTLFLDEIGLLPLPLQAKLLTVVEERAVRRLGATQKEAVDVWIVSASNADLAAEVRARRFREDLFHRLAVVRIEMPPLRERPEDIALLAEHILERTRADYGLPPLSLAPDARERLAAHPWPGNVRELANVIERAVLLGDTTRITAASLGIGDLPGNPPSPAPVDRSQRSFAMGSRDDVMREHLGEVLRASGGNITRAAEILGVSRSTVRAQIRKFGLRANEMGDPGDRLAAPRSGRAPEPATSTSAAPPALPTAGSVRWERRRVTMLHAAFPTPPTEQWSSAGRGLQLVADKVQGFGGVVEGLGPATLDAAFGVDVLEDAPRRAAHAALAVLKAFDRAREHDPELPAPRLVIHSGRALVGYVGDAPRLAQDSRVALTTTLNALTDAAGPGEVVVSASTAASLERRFALEPKAASEPSAPRAYRLSGYEQSGLGLWGTPSRFVGRSQEMEILRSQAGAALAGSGQVIGLVGGPGVGKSRLIWEFMRGRNPLSWRVLEGGCAGGGQTLYHLAAELLQAYFAVDPPRPAAPTRTAIKTALAALDEHLEPALPALLTILGLPSGDLTWERLDGAERRRRMLEAVTGLFVASSRRRPLLVIVEDAHWIDAESQAVLEALVARLARERMLLLISFRPECQHPWADLPWHTELRVDPLPAEKANELLESLLGPDEAFAPFKSALVDWTEGHPFFLEESVRALVEAGALTGERGAYRLARPIARLEVPPTVAEVLATRIDRLSPDDRHLLQTASIIGPHVSHPVLRAVSSLDDEALGASLQRLQAADLLYERSGTGAPELSFRHALTHEVARLSLPPGMLQALHGQVLSVLEQLHHDASADHLERLAYHARAGARWDKALVYAREAGDRALRAAVTPKAVEYYEQGLDALQRAPQNSQTRQDAIDLRLRLRDALWPLGRLPEVFAHLRDAESMAATAQDAWRLGWISCYLSHYFWAVAENARALEAGERALAIARGLNDLALEAETSFYVGITHHARGDFRVASDVLVASVSMLDRAVATEDWRFPSRRFAVNGRAIVRSFLTRSLAELGRFEEGERWGQEGVQIAEAIASPFALVAATAGLATLYIRRDEFDRAVGLLERGLELCRTHSLHNWFPHMAASLGHTYVGMGRVADGIDLIEQAMRDAAESGIRATSSFGLVYLGGAYLRAGQEVKAAEAAQHALDIGRAHDAQGIQAWALWVLGEVEASASHVDRAERDYTDALARATELGMRPLMLRCHLGLARLGGGDAHHHGEQAADLGHEFSIAAPPRLAPGAPR